MGSAGLALVAGPSPVLALVAPDARAAFDRGEYLQAAILAEASGDADGLAFAARARLATTLLTGASRISTAELTRCRRLAQQALRLQPDHVEGRLQLAIALGLEARRVAPALALARQLPQRVRGLIEEVCTDAPREPWGHAIRGSWHLEGVRLAGSQATRLLGASSETGSAAYARATALSTSPTFPAMHAISVLAIDGLRPASRPDLRAAAGPLAAAVARPPVTAFDREMSRRAIELSRLAANGDLTAIKARLARWL
ncbi:MAG: hypothetical protein MUF14_05540 [Hyphomonadaceae bacterium]|nr:hypothetical protein [Hyphomonadaceae bacterium]